MLKHVVLSARERCALPFEVRHKHFDVRLKYLLENCGNALAYMQNEPWFLDDSQKGTVVNFAQFVVSECDLIVFWDDANLVGIACFRGLGRTASFFGWVHPAYRQGFGHQKIVKKFMHEDVFNYAFGKLNLVKLETRACINNRGSLRYLKNTGWTVLGISSMDYLIQGRLYDSVVLEYVNPAYAIQPLEEVENGRREGTSQQSIPDTDVAERPAAKFDSDELLEQRSVDEPAIELDELIRDSPASVDQLVSTTSNVRWPINVVGSWRR